MSICCFVRPYDPFSQDEVPEVEHMNDLSLMKTFQQSARAPDKRVDLGDLG